MGGQEMGAWSAGISGNDTAMDLRSAYQEAFSYFDIDTALQKIDAYVRAEGFKESDPEGWCDYYYSLADFMWKKGILTDAVKNTALHMIDSEFGLAVWAESGKSMLNKRKKALADFREKLLSDQPPKKKIKIDLYMTPVFEAGDVIALQLQTEKKHYVQEKSNFSEEFFRACHGKWVALRKVCDEISYQSKIVPEVKDIWPYFQLYGELFDACPAMADLKKVPFAKAENNPGGVFGTEGNVRLFQRRNARVIGKNMEGLEKASRVNALNDPIYLGPDSPLFGNGETSILNALLQK